MSIFRKFRLEYFDFIDKNALNHMPLVDTCVMQESGISYTEEHARRLVHFRYRSIHVFYVTNIVMDLFLGARSH